ncbi:MAG: biopolymer transporter Tol [Ignavibacteriales bacterium]|nr:biopolymer transporter Tol [Ignavibacteriales bacterium]
MFKAKQLLILFFLLVVSPSFLFSQDDDFPRPDLNWQTIETPHFLTHFHTGAERTAREIAAIAEDVYGPITRLYQHEPDSKVSLVIRDHDDYSNGAAYFYDNKIELWAPALDFELRGSHSWLKDVVSHEFTHIVQIQTAMKLGRTIPAVYFQWLGYEAERRTDVLYGYPNTIVSYPLSAFVVPTWFAEGVAQYNHPTLTYDYWDAHRDMILRMYMLEGKPLTWEEMAVFGKNSLGNESSYNAGFSIVSYIAEHYGAEKLVAISRALSRLPRVTIDGAIADVLGISGEELYEEWKRAKTAQYLSVGTTIAAERTEGELIEKEGFGNFYPAFTPDGKKIAYVSNKGKDYFGLSVVCIYDIQTKTTRTLDVQARSTLSFSPDGRYLYYSKTSRKNGFWAKLFDLYRYDLTTGDEERLTRGLRGWNPKLSPDGTKLVFAYGSDGTVNVGICDADGKNVRQVTKFTQGEQVYTPEWSPDGKVIAFGYSADDKQSVAVINEDGSDFRILVQGVDARNPVFSCDGLSILYSAAEGGIFNVFRLNLAAGSRHQLTNVLGGAFLPTVNAEGDLAFASYTAGGYKIAYVPQTKPLVLAAKLQTPDWILRKYDRVDGSIASVATNAAGGSAAPPGSDTTLGNVGSPKPYRNTYSSISIIPIVRVDNYNPRNKGIDVIRPGFYFTSSDVLDRLSLFGGAVINKRWERDIFGIFEYRGAIPLLYGLGLSPTLALEVYNISRKTDVSFSIFTDREYTVSTDVTYNLFEFDVSLKHKIFDDATQLKVGYSLSRYNADIGSFLVPGSGLSQGFLNLYLIGNMVSAQLTHNGIVPSVDKDINPVGRTITLRYNYEFDKFNPEGVYNIENGVLVPEYTKPSFHRMEILWNEHLKLPMPKTTLSLSIHGASTLGKRVDDFFDSYAGGFIGMRGYPFYALGGNDIAVIGAAYRFPIWTAINIRFLQFYFTKLYGSVFADFGDAWTGAAPALSDWKRDAGFELRLEAFSFYQYPTRIFFSGAYGLDRFSRTFNSQEVTYGKEWRFYLGILFDFEMNTISNSLHSLSTRAR